VKARAKIVGISAGASSGPSSMEGGSSTSRSKLRIKQIRKMEQDIVIQELIANQQKVNQVVSKLETFKKSIH
jgi:hypothetical protein